MNIETIQYPKRPGIFPIENMSIRDMISVDFYNYALIHKINIKGNTLDIEFMDLDGNPCSRYKPEYHCSAH